MYWQPVNEVPPALQHTIHFGELLILSLMLACFVYCICSLWFKTYVCNRLNVIVSFSVLPQGVLQQASVVSLKFNYCHDGAAI